MSKQPLRFERKITRWDGRVPGEYLKKWREKKRGEERKATTTEHRSYLKRWQLKDVTPAMCKKLINEIANKKTIWAQIRVLVLLLWMDKVFISPYRNRDSTPQAYLRTLEREYYGE